MISILVLGAGGVAGINFARALQESKNEYYLIGMDLNPYHLKLLEATRATHGCYLQEEKEPEARIQEINRIVQHHDIDIVHAQPDPEVAFLSENRDQILGRKLLPTKEAIRICQDKRRCVQHWIEAGIRTAWCKPIPGPAPEYPCWIRATRGAGGRGSTFSSGPAVTSHWLAYWQVRGVDWSFVAEEYLPGRNIAVQTLWNQGELLGTVARERIEYIYPHAAPSGITGSSSVTRTIQDGDLLEDLAKRAVLAVDPSPNGAYGVDFKGDRDGILQPTEINAGRFITMSLLTARLGNNMPDMFVRLASGQEVKSEEFKSIPGGTYWLRHMDSPPILVEEENITKWLLKIQTAT
jgi:carbamoyl-phosphate synthase large subunit